MRGVGTNKCLVKQLLCLYPFPHVSQRSSTRLIFLPSRTRGCPSLARRTRDFCMPSPSDMSLRSSSIALSCKSMLTLVATNLWVWVGRLAGGEGTLLAMLGREAPVLDMVLRRPPIIGMAVALSPASDKTAATAAALALLPVTLFRRVTR